MDNIAKSSSSGDFHVADSEVNVAPEVAFQGVNRKAITGLSFASLVIFALSVGLIGPSLTAISRDLQIDLALTGILVLPTFLGIFIATCITGVLSDIFGRRIVVSGLLFISLGLILFGISRQFFALLVGSLLVGLGAGTVEGVISALLIDIYPLRKGYVLNLSQVFGGLGALIGPLIVGVIIGSGGSWRGAFYISAAMSGIVTLLFRLQRFPSAAGLVQQDTDSDILGSCTSSVCENVEKTSMLDGRFLVSLVRNKVFLLSGLSLILYVAAEQGFGVWISAYLEEILYANPFLASCGLSVLWGSLVVGRVVSSMVIERLSYDAFLILSSVGAALGIVGACAVTSISTAILFIGVTGFLFSGIFATLLANAGDKFTSHRGTIYGLLIASGSLGGLLYPPFMGYIAKAVGLRFSIASTSLLLILLAYIVYYTKRSWRSENGSVGV